MAPPPRQNTKCECCILGNVKRTLCDAQQDHINQEKERITRDRCSTTDFSSRGTSRVLKVMLRSRRIIRTTLTMVNANSRMPTGRSRRCHKHLLSQPNNHLARNRDFKLRRVCEDLRCTIKSRLPTQGKPLTAKDFEPCREENKALSKFDRNIGS